MLIKALVFVINMFIKSIAKIGEIGLSILPDSPFIAIEKIEIPFIKSLNWVIPFDFMFTVLSYWVVAIGVYYLAQVILRWAKVIE